jgi:hypothetical protein
LRSNLKALLANIDREPRSGRVRDV